MKTIWRAPQRLRLGKPSRPNHPGSLVSPLCALLLLAAALTAARSGAAQPAQPLGDSPAEDLFTDGLIPRIAIEIAPADMDRLRTRPRTYVSAIVREGPITYTNVSIRLKGGPGSFRPLEDRPAFTLNFGRLAEGQKFHGLKKLHLNNSVQDPTYLSEKIGRELFEAAGVPAPRAGQATVDLNRRQLGMYVLVEGIDQQFLRRYFKDTKGNLYDGHSQSDVTQGMRTNSGDDRRDRSRLKALAAAAQEPDLNQRLVALETTLDLDRFLSFLAVEVMICHWDGYALNRNNFRIYHDRQSDRMVFLPQGVDQIFQRQKIQPFPPMTGLVAKSALEIPQARERYRERLVQLLTNVFQIPVLTNHLNQIAARVQPVLATVDAQEAESYLSRVAGFRRRIQQRVNSLTAQLLSSSPAVKFDNPEILPLSAWEPKIESGHPILRKEQGNDGRTVLHIATQEFGTGSWRTKVLLDAGQYRLEGKVRLQGVKLSGENSKGGAGLRISHRKFGRKLTGDLEWTTLPFDFEVPQDHSDVELVCELRAGQGQVWFDLGSLRLIRRE